MKNLQFAFDVGYSSIGWAVLQINPNDFPRASILGCGVVMFGADDCLASKRRDYRRQRRHTRSTRRRIEQMEKLLAHLKVLSADELKKRHVQAGGHSAPWLLAARVLASNGDAKYLLSWQRLWDVLRWYAHNRGYDGNRRWSTHEAQTAEDTEKEKTANALMEKYGTETMAETLCHALGLDPLGDKKSSKENFKRLNAAFPRDKVEEEVHRLLKLHQKKFPEIDDAFLKCLFRNWQAIVIPGLKLPRRYQGGLLFGQLVPRFDNRIISTCPISGQKVPSRHCPEFLNFRWAMHLANIRVGKIRDRELRPLTGDERKTLDKQIREHGYFTPKELEDTVHAVTACERDNLDTMFMHPDAKEALLLDPVQKLISSDELQPIWKLLPERLQKRLRGRWRRGKAFSLAQIRRQVESLCVDVSALEAELQKQLDAQNSKAKKKEKQITREQFLEKRFPSHPIKLDGRAAFARHLLKQAYEEVLAGKHPKEEGGCLFISEEIRQKQLNREIAEQTNNHLVRHRLLILERLLKGLIAEPMYANSDKSSIAKVTIEVNRDLREMSGKSRKEIEQDLGRRLANHRSVAEKLEKDLEGKTFNGKPIIISAGLIRKARIAEDLNWTCPYTDKIYDAMDLVSRQVDKDHIIPRSLRPSDSLESFVITFAEVNRMKGQRLAWQFVNQDQRKIVDGLPQLSITPIKRFEDRVKALDTWQGHDDDQRRKKRRKELLLLQSYEEKEFMPRDLTVTSQLVRLGAQTIKKNFAEEQEPPIIISLPGAVTGTVRKGWTLLGCLELACPPIMEEFTDADGNKIRQAKTKTEIRKLTHLHHALDACILGLASNYLPNNGGLWEAMIKRNPNDAERALLRTTGFFDFDSEGRFGLTELPNELKEQIRQRLAEKRVVQHIPADMSGMRVEENTRGLIDNRNGRVSLRQKSRDLNTGEISLKKTDESVSKVIGLQPGKLSKQKGIRVITDNFGVAILDHAVDETKKLVVIPYHKVWNRISSLRKDNAGKFPRILRNGHLIKLKEKGQEQIWRVFSVKDTQRGIMIDFGKPDELAPSRGNNRLRTFIKNGMQILNTTYCGQPTHSIVSST